VGTILGLTVFGLWEPRSSKSIKDPRNAHRQAVLRRKTSACGSRGSGLKPPNFHSFGTSRQQRFEGRDSWVSPLIMQFEVNTGSPLRHP
jgi:hypothetical protein